MASGASPAAATFSISVSASEITSVAEDKPEPPKAAPAAKPQKAAEPVRKAPRAAAPAKEQKPVAPKKTKAKDAPKKPSPKIISPDDFFDDKPKRRGGMQGIGDFTALSDDQLTAQLAAMNRTGKKKSVRSMQSADLNIDLNAIADDPQFGGAAQALLEDEQAAAEAQAILNSLS